MNGEPIFTDLQLSWLITLSLQVGFLIGLAAIFLHGLWGCLNVCADMLCMRLGLTPYKKEGANTP